MKKILFILGFIFLFAQNSLTTQSDKNLTRLLNQIPKNSPEYALDLTLVKEIKALKPKSLDFNLSIRDEKSYIDAFNRLVFYKKLSDDLDNKIKELQNKLDILSSKTDPTSKLQYIYYQKLLGIRQNLKKQIDDNLPRYEKTLVEKLKDIKFDSSIAKKNIKKLKKELENYKVKINNLNINLQKWQILNNSDKISQIKKKIENINKKIRDLYKKFINNYEVLWFEALQNKNKDAFNIDDNILYYAKLLDSRIYDIYNEVITEFEKKNFGSKMLVYGAEKSFEYSIKKIWNVLNYPLFSVGNRTITPVNFFMFVLILIIGWFVGKYYKYLIYKIRRKYNLSHATATLLANMGYYAILTLAFLIALKTVGLDLSSLAIIAGALSVGIGFGLQNIVSNFVSGIIMMFERSIKVGDYIQIDENTRGEIVDISMRSTIIRTNDNINLIIPNQAFIQNNVINWTLGDDVVRFRVPFGVAYGSDIDEVERVVLEALKKSNLPYIKKNFKYDVEPRVVFIEMADSSLNFELFVWVRGEYAKRPRRTRSKFLKMIYNALNEAGINIPFPQQDLHIKDSVPFEVRIKKGE